MRWLTETHPAAAQDIHLVGFSMGTMSALAAAHALRAQETPARSLVLFAPFQAMKVGRMGLIGSLVGRHRYDNQPLLQPKRLPPALVLHGGADSALPPSRASASAVGFAPPQDVPRHRSRRAFEASPALADARQGLGL